MDELLTDVCSWVHCAVLPTIPTSFYVLYPLRSLSMEQYEAYHVYLDHFYSSCSYWGLLVSGWVWILSLITIHFLYWSLVLQFCVYFWTEGTLSVMNQFSMQPSSMTIVWEWTLVTIYDQSILSMSFELLVSDCLDIDDGKWRMLGVIEEDFITNTCFWFQMNIPVVDVFASLLRRFHLFFYCWHHKLNVLQPSHVCKSRMSFSRPRTGFRRWLKTEVDCPSMRKQVFHETQLNCSKIFLHLASK